MENITEERVEVRLLPVGSRYINGLSSSYDSDTYPIALMGIVPPEELKSVMNSLNETISSFWPCQTCLMISYVCAPCTLLPFFPTNICVSEAEKAAVRFLEHTSSRRKFYDQRVEFRLEKRPLCCQSFVVVSFPASRLVANSGIQTNGSGDGALVIVSQEQMEEGMATGQTKKQT